MSIAINDNLDVNAPKLIDARSKRPDGNAYASKAEVLALLPESKRDIGLPVFIGQDYYYFKTGVTNESDLHLWTAAVPTSIVETVTGNIVDNTDPINPVVDFLPSSYELSQFNNGGSNPFIKQSDIGNKVDKIPGMGLSQESFTTAEKSKLETVETGAQVNKIERVYVDGVELPIDDKSVFISLSDEVTNINLFIQYSESSVLGVTAINLIQPDLGLPILEVEDLQEDSSYSGELVLNIENNNVTTAKVIDLFRAEVYNNTNPSADITAKITFTLNFFKQVGNNTYYKLSWEYLSSGEVLFGEHTDTVDNTSNEEFVLRVTGHSTDVFNLKKARLWRN